MQRRGMKFTDRRIELKLNHSRCENLNTSGAFQNRSRGGRIATGKREGLVAFRAKLRPRSHQAPKKLQVLKIFI